MPADEALAVRVFQGMRSEENGGVRAGYFAHDYEVAQGLRLDYAEALGGVGDDLFKRAADFVHDVCGKVRPSGRGLRPGGAGYHWNEWS